MRRREFLGVLGGAAALSFPRPGYAQSQTSLPLVGVLSPGRAEMSEDRIAALRLGLPEAGFIEGTNYSLVIRFANGDLDRLPALAKELGELNPRLLVTAGSALAARKILPEIPMVFTGVAIDPVASGLVQSYVRPGGMSTGNVMNAIGGEEAITEKRIGFFKELLPGLSRLGMIGPKSPLSNAELTALRKCRVISVSK